MPRLDAERLETWRALMAATARLERAVERELLDEFAMPLGWFEALGALQRAGAPMRVNELTEELAAVHSSLVRRLDRLEERGWIERRRNTDIIDARAVWVVLTREGRDVWRDANVVYRRGVQTHFARHLTETDLGALSRILGKVGHPDQTD
jgi:DNA-binding MarR family transcriptional regulator